LFRDTPGNGLTAESLTDSDIGIKEESGEDDKGNDEEIH